MRCTLQGDVSVPFVNFYSDNHLSHSYTFEPPQYSGAKHVPLLKEVIERKRTSLPDTDYHDYNQNVKSEGVNYGAISTRQLSLSESFGGEIIRNKISQLKNVMRRVDETLDAVFTLLVPGKVKVDKYQMYCNFFQTVTDLQFYRLAMAV